MNLFSVMMLSLSATSDSFVIGLGFGLKGVRIGYVSNLYISLVCFLGTCLAMLAGSAMGGVIPGAAASLLSAAILLALGVWMLHGAMRRNKERMHGVSVDPQAVDRDDSKTVELRESLSIGLMLSLNNLGIGIGAGMAGLPVLFTSAVCAALSFLFIQFGSALGQALPPGPLAKILEVGAALILMILGVGELCAL